MADVLPPLMHDVDAQQYRVRNHADPLIATDVDTMGARDEAIELALAGWDAVDYEKTGVFKYVGMTRPDGSWRISRQQVANALIRLEASGSSGYGAAWTGRAGLTYA